MELVDITVSLAVLSFLILMPSTTRADVVEILKPLNATCSAISNNCLQCICKIEGCEVGPNTCHMDVGSMSCGPYQIKEQYWIDCGKPGDGYLQCATTLPCSVTCVHNYMKRYGVFCTGGATPTCEDYARIHNGGPTGCEKSSTLGYWYEMKTCCHERFGGKC